ncbi:ABC transporter substrate-binding protein [Paenibacillus sp. NPDC056579]|uniref:ABC transporter substrate-binding protein n=1 Tax=Paenibacillus sp. NPDC056579 TaxID=3345871 RepID=UPI00368B2550
MKKKLMTPLLVALGAMLVLAACGNESSKGAVGESSKSGDAAKDKEFTIRVGSWFIDNRPYQQEFKKSIEEGYKKLYPNAKIQWDTTLGSSYFDKLKAQFASDSAPDVVFFQKKDWFKAGNFMDVSNEPWVNRLTDVGKKNPAVYYDGKLYGAPLGSTPNGGVWYNADLFNELGLKAPTTLQEFIDVCEKLKAAGKTPIALGFKDNWTVTMFLSLWLESYGFANDPQFGKKLYNGEIKLDDPAFQTVYKNVQKFKESGYFNKNALSIDWPASGQLFASGDAAMIIQGPWMPGTNKDNIKKGGFKSFKIGYFPLMDEKGKSAIPLGTNASLAINSKTKLVEESKALINLITTQDILAPWLAGEGSLSYIKDIQVKFDDPAMDEMKSYVDKSSYPYRVDDFIPASAMSALADLTTKVVSGAPFNASDLKPAKDALDRDKATVLLPE